MKQVFEKRLVRIKSILFDMDGVLLDSENGMFGLLQNTLSNKGVDVALESYYIR